MYLIVGLGNPGEEYENTRHNSGRIVLEYFRKKYDFSDWEINKKNKGLTSDGKIPKPMVPNQSGIDGQVGRAGNLPAGKAGSKVLLLEPETFMNKSGISVRFFIANKKQAEKLVVIYDDLDLAMGTFKISFNKGTGGHKGLESIVKNLKTKEFVRIRVGISQTTPTGKLKKSKGEEKILDYLMDDFNKKDLEALKKIMPQIAQALETIILAGRQKAMNLFN